MPSKTARLVAGLMLLSSLAAAQQPPDLPRTLDLPLPLFPDTAWTQMATSASVLPGSSAQIQATLRVLCGDAAYLNFPSPTDWPFPDVNYDHYAIPISAAGSGQQSVGICDYYGAPAWPGPKWPNNVSGGPISLPQCQGNVRPSGPQDLDADGHLVLYQAATRMAYDFWNATTVRSGPCQSAGGGQIGTAILEAGASDYFHLSGVGTNPSGVFSARAMGTPLLAGLILPEDVETGVIAHALSVAVPGPRNLATPPWEPLVSDVFYPAATTETDFYSTDPSALAAGQRVRLRPPGTLVDDSGFTIDESQLAPITQMFFAALRTYGAYVVDNAGGFSFYAEDIHTADLELSNTEVNALIGETGSTLPGDKTKWQVVIEHLNLELESIPFALATCTTGVNCPCGPSAPGSLVLASSNFEVVDPAGGAPLFFDGFDSGGTGFWSDALP